MRGVFSFILISSGNYGSSVFSNRRKITDTVESFMFSELMQAERLNRARKLLFTYVVRIRTRDTTIKGITKGLQIFLLYYWNNRRSL